MRGYPKFIATKQDFINLLADPEHKDQALTDLQEIYNRPDDKILTTTTKKDPDDPMSDWNTAEIDNPMPMWKQKGFESRQEVADLITANGGEV
jgi:hypothetical protein